MHSRRICNKNRSLMLHRLCTKIFKVITCPCLHARIEKWLTNIFDIKVKNDGINLEHIRIFLPATYSTFRLINSQYTMLQKYIDLIFIILPEMNGQDFRHGHVRKPRTRTRTYFGHACPLISECYHELFSITRLTRFQATDEYSESIEEDQAILNEAFDSFQNNYQQPSSSENSTFLESLSKLSDYEKDT